MYSTPPKILSKLPSSPSCDPQNGPEGTPKVHDDRRRKPLVSKTLYARAKFVYPLIALFMLAKHNFCYCDFPPHAFSPFGLLHPLPERVLHFVFCLVIYCQVAMVIGQKIVGQKMFLYV